MNSIKFKLEFPDRVNKNLIATFDFVNPFTKHRLTRKVISTISQKKGESYKDHLQPYIECMIKHNMINPEFLTLAQDKMLQYVIFKYPKSYPHSKNSVPPGISRYFKRMNYDRYCLNKDSGETLKQNKNTMDSKYPARLFAPDKTGTTTLILGSSWTGKTYLLAEELGRVKPYEYDLIILFTESIHVPSLDPIRGRPDILIKEGFHPEIPTFLKNLNSKLKLRYRFLLILDDIISEKSTRHSTLGQMVTTFRNSNISTVVLAQYPTIISKESRGNFHRLVITGMRSPEMNEALTSRFDIKAWAKKRMIEEGKSNGKISNDEVLEYLKHLLMEDGVVMYIDLKKSLDPSIINLNK